MARIGKAKRKREAKNKFNKSLSMFVRGKISAAEYFKLTGQGKK